MTGRLLFVDHVSILYVNISRSHIHKIFFFCININYYYMKQQIQDVSLYSDHHKLANQFNFIPPTSSFSTSALPTLPQGSTNYSLPKIQSKKHRSKKGKWNSLQQKQYIKFIKANMEQMRIKSLRKSEKVFAKMSKIVRTRTPDQCRSHHRKAIKQHLSLQQLVRYYSKKSNNDYRPYFKKMYQKGTSTSDNASKEFLIEKYSRKQNNFLFQINSSLIANY